MRRKGFSFLVATAVFFAFFTWQIGTATAIDFVYSQSGGFLIGSATFGGPGNFVNAPIGGVEFFNLQVTSPGPPVGPAPAGTYSQIGWGCNEAQTNCAAAGNTALPPSPPAPPGTAPMLNPSRSALEVLDQFGSIPQAEITAGTWNDLTILSHKNQPITGNFLTGVDISTILRIGIAPTGLPPSLTDPDVVHVGFTETVNFGTVAECNPTPNPSGSPVPCDDFFTFDPSILAPLSFTAGGQNFIVEFRLVPGPGTVIQGDRVFTAENDTNSLTVQLRILAVPEPATLVLLGTGLLGFVGVATLRRKQSKTS